MRRVARKCPSERGKRKREETESSEEELEGRRKMKREKKEERDGQKGFECGVCLELMCWEKEPRTLLSCPHSFCSPCLSKLFQPHSSSSSSSSPSSERSSSSSSAPTSSSPSSSSSPSLSPSPPQSSSSLSSRSSGGVVRCPVCRKANECESIESFELNFLIPETIDVLVSSKVISLPHQQQSSGKQSKMKCDNFEVCGERTQMYCSDCKMFICDTCNSSHSSYFATRNHIRKQQQQQQHPQTTQIIGGDGGSIGDGLEMMKMKRCLQHPSERISGFCFECSVLVCLQCVLEKHVNHNKEVSSVEGTIEKRREQVLKMGAKVENRLKEIETEDKRIEEEVKELEKKLEKKRGEKKEIELEKEDLKMRKDSIIRLSSITPTDISFFFDEQLFSTLLQTASEIDEAVVDCCGYGLPKKGSICCDGVGYVSSLFIGEEDFHSGLSMNSDGTLFIIATDADQEECFVRVRDRERNAIESVEEAINSLPLNLVALTIGLGDQIVILSEEQVLVLDKEGEFLRSFGSEGSKSGQFNNPQGVVVDAEGHIIVADTGNNRIQVFDNDGCFIRSFGTSGSAEGQFHSPAKVAIDRREGHLVICDKFNFRIQVMDIEGNFIRSLGGDDETDSPFDFDLPIDVDVDGEGRIVVADAMRKRVSVFEEDGTFLFSFGESNLEHPTGVVVDSNGSIFVLDSELESVELYGFKIDLEEEGLSEDEDEDDSGDEEGSSEEEEDDDEGECDEEGGEEEVDGEESDEEGSEEEEEEGEEEEVDAEEGDEEDSSEEGEEFEVVWV